MYLSLCVCLCVNLDPPCLFASPLSTLCHMFCLQVMEVGPIKETTMSAEVGLFERVGLSCRVSTRLFFCSLKHLFLAVHCREVSKNGGVASVELFLS